MHGALGAMTPPPDVIKEARSNAVDLVRVIPDKVVDNINDAQQGPMTVLVRLAQLHADTVGMPFFYQHVVDG